MRMRLVLSALVAGAALAPAAPHMVDPTPVLMMPSLPERLPVPTWVHSRRDVPVHVRVLFAFLDANRDRAITKDEFERGGERQAREFALLSRDDNWRRRPEGAMRVELATLGGPMFHQADVNRDGRVSLREAMAIAYRHFERMDVDRDGNISRDERSQRSEMTRRPTQIAVIPPGSEPATAAELRKVAEANRGFGLALYRRLATEPGNVFISPISLAGAFGPVAAGARGGTRAAIGKVLGFPTDDRELHRGLGDALRQIERDSQGARVSVANALWLMQGFPVTPSFVTVSRERYAATVENLDFGNSPQAAARINEWVSSKTNGRIPLLFEPSAFNGTRTALVVTNAVYFLGEWEVPFNAASTRLHPFHLTEGGTREVPMMSGDGMYRYAESGPVQLLELPYKGGRQSMVVVLPKTRGALGMVERQLDNGLADWLRQLDSAAPQHVGVQLPKVQIASSYKLVAPLTAMGMGIAFDPSRADLSGIGERGLVISDVVHKTFLRIEEKGTEAGAATAVTVGPPSGPSNVFRADHPFLVLIRDKHTGAVLFLGRIANPEGT